MCVCGGGGGGEVHSTLGDIISALGMFHKNTEIPPMH